MDHNLTRRWVLRASGTIGVTGLAGCSGLRSIIDGSEETSPGYLDDEAEQTVREYLLARENGNQEKVSQIARDDAELPGTEGYNIESESFSLIIERVGVTEISSSKASVVATATVTGVDSDVSEEFTWEFELRRSGDGWVITGTTRYGIDDEGSDGTIELTFVGEPNDESLNWSYWELENHTGELIRLASINRLDPDGNHDIVMMHRIAPGSTREFTHNRADGDPSILSIGTWVESKLKQTEEEVDTTARPTGIVNGIGTSPGYVRTEFELPNVTEMASGDVREVEFSSAAEERFTAGDLGSASIEDGNITFPARGVTWAEPLVAEVDGVNDSETFTFTTPGPELEVSIDDAVIEDTIAEPTITFEATSSAPVVNPVVAILTPGPSVTDGPSYYREKAEIDEERALITTATGVDRVGRSRTMTFDEYQTTVADFPFEDNDVLGVSVLSVEQGDVVRYPVAYTERSLAELAD